MPRASTEAATLNINVFRIFTILALRLVFSAPFYFGSCRLTVAMKGKLLLLTAFAEDLEVYRWRKSAVACNFSKSAPFANTLHQDAGEPFRDLSRSPTGRRIFEKPRE